MPRHGAGALDLSSLCRRGAGRGVRAVHEEVLPSARGVFELDWEMKMTQEILDDLTAAGAPTPGSANSATAAATSCRSLSPCGATWLGRG